MEKPKAVKFAVNLLWASQGLGLLSWILTGFKTASDADPVGIAIVLVFIFGVALINFKIFAGRIWARNIFAIHRRSTATMKKGNMAF